MTVASPFRPMRLPLLALLIAAGATGAAAQTGFSRSFAPQSSGLPLPGYPAPQGLTPRVAPGPLLADPNDPAEALARYLRTLSDSPTDLAALTGAGRAALAIGDANAALAFYARAEEISPRDGRIKAGLGSAMLQLEKPKEAIGLFDEATSLGVMEADIAGDRGLAWDLRGDPRRAQRDYAIAMRSNPDDEIKRRMALSLAISGDAAGADAMLDPLLRRQDRAAWRARAFILAMSGDVAKADVVARSAMSPAQVAALHPFLVRLASLRPAQKALAVNFGEMPSDGKAYSPAELAAIDGQPLRLDGASVPGGGVAAGSGLVPAGEPWGPRAGASALADSGSGDEGPVSTAPRRRPGRSDLLALASPPSLTAKSGTRFAATADPVERAPARADAAPSLPAKTSGERHRVETPPRAAPLIAAPAAAAPPPIFFASVAPAPTAAAVTSTESSSVAASPPPAPTILAATDAPSPSLSALDPAIAQRARQEDAAPGPVELASAIIPPPIEGGAGQDQPVALPPVGYKLPPPAPKPVPADEAAAKTDGVPEPDRVSSAKPEGGKKAVSSKARVSGRGEQASEDADKKATARKASGKSASSTARGDDDETVATSDKKKPAAGKGAAAKDSADKGVSGKGVTAKKAGKKDADADAKPSKSDAKDKDATDKPGKDKSGKAKAADKKSETKKDDGKGGKKASKKDDDDKADAKSSKSDKAAPQRVWVQVAGGATKADLPKAWGKLKGKAPALAKGQSIYTTPLKATNRLLVGPFKSADEAQAYVNRMGKSGLSGFTFTSDKGQQVDKLDTGK